MKLVYDITSGDVIRVTPDLNPILVDNQAELDVPDGIIPQTIVHVYPDGRFDTDPAIVDLMWNSVRSCRNRLLRESDWSCSITDYIVPDKEKWIAYCQALRDLTSQPNPFTAVWPKAPNA